MQDSHADQPDAAAASPSVEDSAVAARLTRRSPHHPFVDARDVIQHDYLCVGCGYNLRGITQESDCPECGKAIAQTVERRKLLESNKWHLREFPVISRLGYVMLGLLLPILCFLFAFNQSLIAPDWQDNRWTGTVQMLYGGWPLIIFFPLLFYAMLGFLLMVLRPLHFGQFDTIRFGVYSGVPLALQYHLILCLATGEVAAILIPASLLGLLILFAVFTGLGRLIRFYRYGSEQFKRIVHLVAAGVIGIMVMGITLDIMFVQGSATLGLIGIVVVILLLAAPAWTLLVYLMLSVRIIKSNLGQSTSNQRHLFGATWLSVWLGSLVAAIYLAIQEYEKLPTSPPGGCYIATAAARGHRRWVRSQPIRCRDGSIMFINNQLRLCKVAELALWALSPAAHRILRNLYDRLGPPIARRLRHPLLADLAYLTLLPPAFFAYCLLSIMGCDVRQLMQRVYDQSQADRPDAGR